MKKILLLLVIASLSFSANMDARRVHSCKTCLKKNYIKKG